MAASTHKGSQDSGCPVLLLPLIGGEGWNYMNGSPLGQTAASGGAAAGAPWSIKSMGGAHKEKKQKDSSRHCNQPMKLPACLLVFSRSLVILPFPCLCSR